MTHLRYSFLAENGLAKKYLLIMKHITDRDSFSGLLVNATLLKGGMTAVTGINKCVQMGLDLITQSLFCQCDEKEAGITTKTNTLSCTQIANGCILTPSTPQQSNAPASLITGKFTEVPKPCMLTQSSHKTVGLKNVNCVKFCCGPYNVVCIKELHM